MPNITNVTLTGIAAATPPATGWTISYSYTFTCTPRECAANASFAVNLMIWGEDLFFDDVVSAWLTLPGAAHPAHRPGTACPPVTMTGTVNYTGSLNEDWGQDEIYVEISMRPSIGCALARASSNVISGNF